MEMAISDGFRPLSLDELDLVTGADGSIGGMLEAAAVGIGGAIGAAAGAVVGTAVGGPIGGGVGGVAGAGLGAAGGYAIYHMIAD